MSQASARTDQWIEAAPSPKWVRVLFSGAVIADSKHVLLLRESRRTPVYYFPIDDVRMDLLEPTGNTAPSRGKGSASYWTIRVDDRVAENAAWGFPDPLPEASGLKDHLAFEWGKMDAWFEESEEVYVHARDPYKRVDVLPSSRHVRIVIAGETVADSHRPVLLFETGLPMRSYIPKDDVRQDLLRPSESVTRCPYKGEARYYSAAVGDEVEGDIAWHYRYPTTECSKIAGLIAFYDERVDLYLDGELQPKPQTRWTRGR